MDVASDQQVQGLRAKLVIDRDTAARFGITTTAIDQTLYDAYGQRQVSTMFTQLNQYHVVLEVKPNFQNSPSSLREPVYWDYAELRIDGIVGAQPTGIFSCVSPGSFDVSIPKRLARRRSARFPTSNRAPFRSP